MERQIININKDKCIGCGLCANTCHQNAIQIIDGKASLVKDDYCDGLGNCLSGCPTNAISFINIFKNKNVPFDGMSVVDTPITPCTMAQKIQHSDNNKECNDVLQSTLGNWPLQLKLVPSKADFYDKADLLISADCCAYAYASFNSIIMKNKITTIGCPKLDDLDYSQKIYDIIINNNINSITLTKMEVPCCNALLSKVNIALEKSKKSIPLNVITISIDGKIL